MHCSKAGSLRIFMASMTAVMLGLSGTAAGAFPQAEVSAAVSNKVNQDDFDAKLYKALLNQCDTNGDGTLTIDELAAPTYVDLSGNKLTNLKGIEYLSGVTYLDLSNNSLFSMDGLKYNYRLTYLDISNNKFKTLDSISDNADTYTSLKELNASGNQLTDMSGAVVCSNLETLDLSDNQLSTVGSSIVVMKQLKSLDLSNNRLSSISGLPSSLTSVSLSGNQLTDLSFMNRLSSLKYLDASNNLIASASGLMTGNLETLYLEDNLLKTLGDLTGAKNCEIDVSHNRIDTYSAAEQNYSETLRLAGNAVTAVPQDLAGWQYQNGAVYYFTNSSGSYVTGTTTISGKSYTFNSQGVLNGTEEKAPVKPSETPSDSKDDDVINADKPSGDSSDNPIPGSWQQSGDKWYLVDSDGNMLTGWQKYDTAWYYLNSDGSMKTGWLQDGSTWYYLYDWGGMATGWYKVGGSWFYADASGKMYSNKWLEYKGDWYYLQNSGAMAKNWFTKDGKWYYMGSDGVMRTGWQDIGGSTYYMSTTKGYCATGWCKIDGKTYYFDTTSCKLAKNTTIGGYKVDENGVYVG